MVSKQERPKDDQAEAIPNGSLPRANEVKSVELGCEVRFLEADEGATKEPFHGAKLPILPAAGSWQSANALAKLGARGGTVALNRAMSDLRAALVYDIEKACGMSPDEASAYIAVHLLGMRRPTRGAPALHASADAVAIMERDGILLYLSGAPPPRLEGWRSANNMSRRDFIGNQLSIEKKLLRLRSSLIEQIIDTVGLHPSVAEGVVDDHFVGMRKPARGPESLHASCLTIELLERDGILRRRCHSSSHSAQVEPFS